MDAVQAVRLEERRPRALGLRRATDPLDPVEHLVPEAAHRLRVGRHEPQLGTARERLTQPHARHHPERLGGRGDLPHGLLSARLGGQRHRLSHSALRSLRAARRANRWIRTQTTTGERMFAYG